MHIDRRLVLVLAAFVCNAVCENVKITAHRRQKRSTCHQKFQHITGHTACISKSSDFISGGVSSSEKETILNLHNNYRAGVSPSATNMLKMTWDDEIAMLAQKWAENCDFSHDGNYQRYIPGRFSVGQNLYYTTANQKNWQAAMSAWYNEVNHFSYGSSGSGSTNGKAVGHYTQIVWAKSYKLGCAYAKCKNKPQNFYVCNYGPGGNIVNEGLSTPYKSGSSCADCGSKCSNKLCDCGSKACYNGGTMDVNTCACTCKPQSFIQGDSCALKCEGSTDPSYCGTSFTEAKCSDYTNLPYDCPNMCKTCPHGSTDVSVTTTTTSSDGLTTTTSDSGQPGTKSDTVTPVVTTGSTDVSDTTTAPSSNELTTTTFDSGQPGTDSSAEPDTSTPVLTTVGDGSGGGANVNSPLGMSVLLCLALLVNHLIF